VILLAVDSLRVAAADPVNAEEVLVALVDETVIERGPHHRVIETTRLVAKAREEPVLTKGRYTDVRNGMHYLRDGGWVETEELIDAYPGGAAALRGPHQVIFPKDLASPEGVDLLTPDVRRLRFRMLGLAWLDQATGQRHWLARVQSVRLASIFTRVA
jgi:hypothetical protein